MLHLWNQIEAARDWIRARWGGAPRVGLILGTGLGRLAEEIDVEAAFPFAAIPHLPQSTALGHKGQWLCGELDGLPVLAMEGRLHAYEGYPLWQATLPVRVMRALGVQTLVLSNAAGGLNPQFECGDVALIHDHINLMFDSPLIGPHDERLGPRFPDMSQPYDRGLQHTVRQVALRAGVPLREGVYIGVKGPNFETRAEYRFLRRIGGDMVGMSTVPETIVAVQAGMRVLAFSAISNVCLPDELERATGESVIAASERAEPKLRRIVRDTLAALRRQEWSTDGVMGQGSSRTSPAAIVTGEA